MCLNVSKSVWLETGFRIPVFDCNCDQLKGICFLMGRSVNIYQHILQRKQPENGTSTEDGEDQLTQAVSKAQRLEKVHRRHIQPT